MPDAAPIIWSPVTITLRFNRTGLLSLRAYIFAPIGALPDAAAALQCESPEFHKRSVLDCNEGVLQERDRDAGRADIARWPEEELAC